MKPDNDQVEPTVRGSHPLVIMRDGRWLWYVLGSGLAGAPEYREEPELEQILLAALARTGERRAA